MTLQISPQGPVGAAKAQRQKPGMDIVLHLGVHRTANATLHTVLQANAPALAEAGVAVWAPDTTRSGLLDGIIPGGPSQAPHKSPPRRASGRVKLRLEELRAQSRSALLVSEPGLIGSARLNLREGELYPAIGERMSRYAHAFDGQISRITLSIRAQDRFWASSLAAAVAAGHPVPGARKIDALVETRRRWQDVITDLACAVPDTKITVLPFESSCGNPASLLRSGAELPVFLPGQPIWENRAPTARRLRALLQERGQDPDQIPDTDGLWQPFSHAQTVALREAYNDDLHWLVAGADGLARLTEEAMPAGRGQARHAGQLRGHDHDTKGQLGQAG